MDDVIQKILLEGDGEILEALRKMGEEGSKVFEDLAKAAQGGAGSMEELANAIGGIVGIISTATAAMVAFVETQNSATQTAGFLADSFGATTAQIEGLEAAFTQAGVSVQTFERFAQRMATTIARDWPQITASVRTSATQMSEANTAVAASTLRVSEAQSAVVTSTERVAAAQRTLQFAAVEAAAKATQGYLNIQSASVSLASAEQHLAEVQGGPALNASQKRALDISNAELAVAKAKQAVYEANLAQEKQEAEAQANIEKAVHGVTAAKEAQAKALLGITEAENAAATAAENYTKRQLADLPTIAAALKGVEDHNRAAATSINLQEVSVQNLGKAIQKMASDNSGGGQPTAMKTTLELAKLLKQADEDLLPPATQLALVSQLSGQRMLQAAGSAAELVKALKNLGSDEAQAYVKQAEASYSASEQGRKAVEDFKAAFEGLSLQLSLTNRDLAALASPALTSFLDALKTSLRDTDGLLHNIVEAVKAVSTAISTVVSIAITGFEKMAASIGIDKWTALRIVIVAVIGIIAGFATPFLAVPATIALIVTAAGLMYEAFFKIGEVIGNVWNKIKDNAVVQWITDVASKIGGVVAMAAKLLGYGSDSKGSTGKDSAAISGPVVGGTDTATEGKARGGMIEGPGSHTSDSVLARLSRGEFVMRAAAVQQFGASFMHAINNGFLPGFASGGMVPSPVRMGGGASMPATSTLNLSIDGRSFGGLRGPKTTIDDLTSFAISRQTSQAGNRPSWYK